MRLETLDQGVNSLKFLTEHSCLAPAYYLERWETILVNQAEVFARVAQDFFPRMRFEAEQDFEECRCGGRTAWNVKQVAPWRDDSGNLRHTFIERYVFQRAAGDD